MFANWYIRSRFDWSDFWCDGSDLIVGVSKIHHHEAGDPSNPSVMLYFIWPVLCPSMSPGLINRRQSAILVAHYHRFRLFTISFLGDGGFESAYERNVPFNSELLCDPRIQFPVLARYGCTFTNQECFWEEWSFSVTGNRWIDKMFLLWQSCIPQNSRLGKHSHDWKGNWIERNFTCLRPLWGSGKLMIAITTTSEIPKRRYCPEKSVHSLWMIPAPSLA